VPRDVPDAFRAAVLAWFDRRGRELAFRRTRDPYAVLVSEVMAQQTQVTRVAERWSSFISRFPDFGTLAAATPADVLREWRGLGYNRRAIGLWRTARLVVAEHHGRLPADVLELERLPGVGPYTARAVAAIAFGRPVGAVDTNVRRVLGRVVGGARGLTPNELQATADTIVPIDRAADWTHALMDLGAVFCRPRDPGCAACPARQWCRFAGSPSKAIPRGARRRGTPFALSTRWLRGRIVERLAAQPAGGWVRFDGPIGKHEPAAVAAALAALSRDGIVERASTDHLQARLPVSTTLDP
jgi:A/G-specific adenine glycosylase